MPRVMFLHLLRMILVEIGSPKLAVFTFLIISRGKPSNTRVRIRNALALITYAVHVYISCVYRRTLLCSERCFRIEMATLFSYFSKLPGKKTEKTSPKAGDKAETDKSVSPKENAKEKLSTSPPSKSKSEITSE